MAYQTTLQDQMEIVCISDVEDPLEGSVLLIAMKITKLLVCDEQKQFQAN